jgi:hypothetical protein
MTAALALGAYYYVYHRGESAAKGNFVAATAKSNTSLKAGLDKAGKKIETKYAPRAAFREGAKEYFEKELDKHDEKVKAVDGSFPNGISDDGVQLINAAINCRYSESAGAGLGKVSGTVEAERERGRQGCKVGG